MSVETVKVSGLSELEEAFKGMEDAQCKRIVRASLKVGAKPIENQAKADAPKRTGKLANSIRVKAGGSRGSVIGTRIQTSEKDNLFTGDQFYGGFLEFGFKKVPVTRGPGGRFFSATRGTEPLTPVEGKHFMQKAAEQAGEQAVQDFANEAHRRIEKYVAKLEKGSE